MPGPEWILLYLVLGALAGFMAGLLGVGGGGILVPLLTFAFSWQTISVENSVHLALGTSLSCMIVSTAASMRAHARHGAVDWRIVAGMAPGIIVGAFLATQIAAYLDATWVALCFALFMALVALQIFLDWHPRPSQTPMTVGGLLVAGTGIGSASALAAIGGGFFTFTYLSYMNVDTKKAIGTAAAIGFPVAITGTLGYLISGWSETQSASHTLGFIHVPAFLAISSVSFVAAPLGARYAHRLPAVTLKKIFAVIALTLSIAMLLSIAEF